MANHGRLDTDSSPIPLPFLTHFQSVLLEMLSSQEIKTNNLGPTYSSDWEVMKEVQVSKGVGRLGKAF